MSDIVYIGIEHIHPHPENPRKDLGDLTELVESVKKLGVMQNLTVIPQEGSPGEYTALIGHRRHAAAKLAGIAELPCIIKEGMYPSCSKKICRGMTSRFLSRHKVFR